MEKRERDTQELWDSYKKCSIHIVGLPQKKEKKYLKQYKDWEFSKISDRQQTTSIGTSENIKQNKQNKIFT